MSSSTQSIVESDRSLGETCAGFRVSLERFDEFTKDQQAVVAEYEKLSALLKKRIAEYEQALLEVHQRSSVPTIHEGREHGEITLASYDQDEVEETIRDSALICDRLERELASGQFNVTKFFKFKFTFVKSSPPPCHLNFKLTEARMYCTCDIFRWNFVRSVHLSQSDKY